MSAGIEGEGPVTSSAAAMSSALDAVGALQRARREADERMIAGLAPDTARHLADFGPDLAELLGLCPAERWPELRDVLLARARARA